MATDQARSSTAEPVRYDSPAYISPLVDFLVLLAVATFIAIASVALIVP